MEPMVSSHSSRTNFSVQELEAEYSTDPHYEPPPAGLFKTSPFTASINDEQKGIELTG